ncbi:MAG TPA: CheR family methyltransferase [Pseudoduganella sp.]
MNMNPPGTSEKAEQLVPSAKFPLVGIGASAGGLDALERLLPGLPATPGFSIVIILHLAPDQPSQSAVMLRRFSNMPVVQVTRHPTEILVNHVYIIAPGTLLKVEDCYLFLDEANAGRTTFGAIDYFFHALALSHRHLGVGVLLSGMGQDGCGGLAALREQGGTAIVQFPQDAQFGPLPQAAIDANVADVVLPASEIAQRLLILCEAAAQTLPGHGGEDEAKAVQEVLEILHDRTGHDFRRYKRPTILRRLERRLHLHGVRSVADYRTLLARDGDEASRLMKDLLIGVTGFFRDRRAFERLREVALKPLMESRAHGELRVWVAACSTGQEAYSLAMLLADMARTMTDPPLIHIFASDIDEQALGVARAGLYPESIRDEVPSAMLERYFVRTGVHFRVRQDLRDLITFASHNLLRDPPFSGLDLVTCRNLMIYLDRSMQQLVLQRFHFGLARGGFLFLGSAETADTVTELFGQVDRTCRIYQAHIVQGKPPPRYMAPAASAATAAALKQVPALRHVPGLEQAMPSSMEEMRDRLAAAETSCQQLQSDNEELSTINAEIKARLEDTGKANDDLNNLIASVDLATVFVGQDLVIKRFTPRAASIFSLIPRDVGRNLLDITHRLDYPELEDDVARTFDTLQQIEREVHGTDGRHFIVRLRPYRTGDETIAGAVMTFFDISQRRVAEDEAAALASDQEFLLRLGDCLRPLEDPQQLLELGCRMLGERLALPQLAYGEIRDGRYVMLPGHASGTAPLQGEGEVAALGAAVLERWSKGEVAVQEDLARAGPSMDGGMAGLAGGRGALLSSVCRKGTQWLGFFLGCQHAARQWTRPEVALFAETAARIGVEFERARAQAALQASETRLHVLLRGFAQECWETDASGEDGDDGEDWLACVHPDDRARAQAMWREAVRNGAGMEAEVRLLGEAGTWRRASVLAVPLFDELGNVRKWSGCIVDTDEREAAPSGSI